MNSDLLHQEMGHLYNNPDLKHHRAVPLDYQRGKCWRKINQQSSGSRCYSCFFLEKCKNKISLLFLSCEVSLIILVLAIYGADNRNCGKGGEF